MAAGIRVERQCGKTDPGNRNFHCPAIESVLLNVWEVLPRSYAHNAFGNRCGHYFLAGSRIDIETARFSFKILATSSVAEDTSDRS